MGSSENYWWYITLKAPLGSEEILNSLAEASGSIGSEEDSGRNSGAELRAYYRSSQDLGAWLEVLGPLMEPWPEVKIKDMGKIENRPWNREWMEAFPPLNVGERLTVMAPWHAGKEKIDGHRIPLYIYPGSAFGTGYHESTQAVLRLLERHLVPGTVVADIGCGSGILSIAALKLGALKAYARDLDPSVIDEALRNILELNGLTAEQFDVAVGDLLKDFDHRVDMVMANILLEPLKAMLPQVASVLNPGGQAIFSGMVASEAQEFEALLPSAGLKLIDQICCAGWCSLAAELA